MKSLLSLFNSFVVGILVLFGNHSAIAQSFSSEKMTPAEVFARCYAKLMRKPIPLDYTTLIALRASNNMDDAQKACVGLINKANLGADDKIANTFDPESKGVLETMHLLHNSFFTAKVLGVGNTLENKLVVDVDEPGLYWTRAMFKDQVRADSVVTYNKGLKSIRVRSNDGGITHFQARSFFDYNTVIVGVAARDPLFRIQFPIDLKLDLGDGSNYATIDVPDDQLSQFGELVGVKDQSPLTVGRLSLPLITPNTGVNATVNTILRDPAQAPNKDVDLHAHFGGGVVGSVVYGLKNSNFIEGTLANSYTRINRRFSAQVFSDLLCHQLPTLTVEDVELVPGSNLPFQQNKSCMQCHATIDEFAMIQRNYVWATSSRLIGNFLPNSPPKGVQILTRFQLPVRTETGAHFALGNPSGELHFRTFSGEKVRMNIQNFSDVGNQFAKLDDFYLCAAKRYYKYFTGVDVSLDGKPANPLEKKHLEIVQDIGLKLKEDQSLKNLVANIFKSSVFRSRNYNTQGGVQ